MTIIVTKDIFCEGENCVAWTDGVSGWQVANVDARVNAQLNAGYGRFARGRYLVDLCPSCQTPEEQAIVAKRQGAAADRGQQSHDQSAPGLANPTRLVSPSTQLEGP